MKKIILPIIAASAIVFSSCGGGAEAPVASAKSEAELVDGFNSVKGRFKEIFNNPQDHKQEDLNPLSDSLGYYVDALINNYPKSAQLPEVLCNAGVSALNSKDGKNAVRFLEYVVDSFPDHALVAKSLYFIGRTKEVLFNDVEGAKEAYKTLYRSFPNTDWAFNAQASIREINNPMMIEASPEDAENDTTEIIED